MKEFISDATGTHALEHVVAITPVVDKAPPGVVPRSRAVLHMAGGQFFATDTDYAVALEAWGYVAPKPDPKESK